MLPVLRVQEVPLDHPDSVNMFRPGPEKPFVATPAAIEAYQRETIQKCLLILQQQADKFNGIDRLQVFKSPEPGKPDLWVIEDSAITALLPSDY